MNEKIIQRENGLFRCVHNKFIVDETLDHVKCGLCGESLNPVWALGQLSNRESRAIRHIEIMEKIAEKAEKKNRCKCEHCHKMTRIQK